MKTDIFLLDLDGVLIRPGGYRAAVRASMAYLLDRMGLDMQPPGDEVPALLEALGITSEWDMVSVQLGLLLNAVANHAGRPLPSLTLEQALDWAANQATRGFSFDYAAAVRDMTGVVPPGGLPARALRAAVSGNTYPALFSHLDHQPFVDELFNPARDVHNSLPTRLVQTYVLGHQVFEQTYHFPAPVESSSLLSEWDAPALLPELSAQMLDRWQHRRLYLSAFTARPSLPPRDSHQPLPGYSPEAEMALRLVGLQEIPILGYGRLQWLAEQVGGVAEEYLKPAAEQPLSAAYAALTGLEADGLRWAYQVCREPSTARKHPFPPYLRLHVFEDSSIGLVGGQAAARVLSQLGTAVELHRWGITTVPEKASALRTAGADEIFPDVNTAVRFVLNFIDR